MNAVQLQSAILAGAGPQVDPSAPAWVQYLQAHRVEVVAAVACLGLMILVFELVRRHRIKERYSFLWFVTGLSLSVLVLKRDLLAKFSAMVGVYYPPTALLLFLSFFMIIMLVHFSTVITKLLGQNQKLAQKIALLEAELQELKVPEHERDGG